MTNDLEAARLALKPVIAGELSPDVDLPTRMQMVATTMAQLDVLLTALGPLCEAARCCGVQVEIHHAEDPFANRHAYTVSYRLLNAHRLEQAYSITPAVARIERRHTTPIQPTPPAG